MKTTKQVHRLYGSIIAFAKATKHYNEKLNLNSHKLLLESILVCNEHPDDEVLCLSQAEKLNNERFRLFPECKNCQRRCDQHTEYIKYKLMHTEEIQKNYLFSIITSISNYTDILIKEKEKNEISKQIDFIYESLCNLNKNNVIENLQKNVIDGLKILSTTLYRVYV